MSESLNNGSANQNLYSEDFSIAFLGKELFFSNQTLRSVQTEFGVCALRFETLEAMSEHVPGSSRIVVVDQMLIEDLLARPTAYTNSTGSGCLAFAYRKEESARHMFESWDRAKFGELGFLPMNVAPDAWRAILRLLMHEELYLPSFLADCVSSPCQRAPEIFSQPKPIAPNGVDRHAQYSKLTRREKQVLQLVSQGKSNKLIAAKLGITEHTVKLHMHNVVGKIGVSNRTAAAHFYFEVAPHEAHQTTVD
ncbi:response regulator transcription factor [uncultured Ruegeria sp.]|uniref:helix-turn-helix transcriptional regulator n=1 Tax=uncultured Ruegeria sp. TaxID=259304 RepID=UPI0026344B56|nr:response regulator transcription factor [uncultured Ruegeria sp.]